MWNSSLVVFHTDNGGPQDHACNWPMRGYKFGVSFFDNHHWLLLLFVPACSDFCSFAGCRWQVWEGSVRGVSLSSRD
jgi:hypothetical protein